MIRYNSYVVRDYVEDECGCGTFRERQVVVPEEDCGCQDLSPGARVMLRYDRFGNAWIVNADEQACGCVDTDFGARTDCGPRYGFREPYRGVYLAEKKVAVAEGEGKKEEKQGGACTE